MAIKVNNTTVIDNDLSLNVTRIDGLYNNYHPKVNSLTSSSISLKDPVNERTMTSNTSYTISFATNRKSTVLYLDRTTSNYTPSFSGVTWYGGAEPGWSINRYWVITFNSTLWGIFASATGYDF